MRGTALIIHPDFYSLLGGGERVAASTAEVLRNLGYKVSLVTRPPFRIDAAKDILGIDLGWISHLPFPSIRVPYGPMRYYGLLISARLCTAMIKRELIGTHPELEIVTDRPEYMLNHGRRKIIYFHEVSSPHVHSRKAYRSIVWPADRYMIEKINSHADALVTSGLYLKEAIKKYYYRPTFVIPPPVRTSMFEISANGSKDPRMVITVGRISRYKRLELVLQLAVLLPAYEFYICGTLADVEYYEFLHRTVSDRKLANVHLEANIRSESLVKLLASAKIYLHTRIDEGFGISIVEAMAAGCLPIVHKSGGPPFLVGRLGKTYTTVAEAARCIEEARYEDVDSERLVAWSKEFDEAKFKDRMTALLREIAQSRGVN